MLSSLKEREWNEKREEDNLKQKSVNKNLSKKINKCWTENDKEQNGGLGAR